MLNLLCQPKQAHSRVMIILPLEFPLSTYMHVYTDRLDHGANSAVTSL